MIRNATNKHPGMKISFLLPFLENMFNNGRFLCKFSNHRHKSQSFRILR